MRVTRGLGVMDSLIVLFDIVLFKAENRRYELAVLIYIYIYTHYTGVKNTQYSRVISPSTERFSWEGEETPAVYRSLYDRGEVSPALGLR